MWDRASRLHASSVRYERKWFFWCNPTAIWVGRGTASETALKSWQSYQRANRDGLCLGRSLPFFRQLLVELVAHPPDGQHEFRIAWIRFDLGAQPVDV